MLSSITYRSRWRWFGAVFVYLWILYFVANRQTVVAPHALPLTSVDTGLPFLPWTGWIYAAVFVMPLFAVLAVKTDEDVRALVVSFAAMATFDSLIFFVYPTVYPRPLMSAVPAFGVELPLVLIRFCDAPTNCFPSQHVAAAFLTAFHIRRFSKGWGAAGFLLAAAIAVSTLTTKQHYLWDVLAGALVGGAAYRLSARGAATR